MKSYFYSIAVRFYLALSGFLVFLLTAALFGADGRGTIGFATSLFAIVGITFSANLGRAFVSLTKQNDQLKRGLLRRFLRLNIALSLAAVLAGLAYWYFSETARSVLTLKQALWFSLIAPFYVWSINGNAIFASFVATKNQENIILATRTGLIAFLIALYAAKDVFLDTFIAVYSILLFLGALAEILWLYFSFGERNETPLQASGNILKESLVHHLDFLSFNLFPLFLTILLASYVDRSEVGRFNFALQIINLVFLFSTIANIRLTAYVSDVGIGSRLVQTRKLFWSTSAVSVFSIFLISYMIKWATASATFEQFQGVDRLFMICGLALPGYILYQFFSPVWIELKKQKRAAMVHLLNALFFVGVSPFILRAYGIIGAVFLFSLFHCGLAAAQAYLFYHSRLDKRSRVARRLQEGAS